MYACLRARQGGFGDWSVSVQPSTMAVIREPTAARSPRAFLRRLDLPPHRGAARRSLHPHRRRTRASVRKPPSDERCKEWPILCASDRHADEWRREALPQTGASALLAFELLGESGCDSIGQVTDLGLGGVFGSLVIAPDHVTSLAVDQEDRPAGARHRLDPRLARIGEGCHGIGLLRFRATI